MPDLSVRIDTEIYFEVYCDTCGTGLCSNTTTRGTTIYIDACPHCMTEKDNEINELKDEISELNRQIDKLNETLSHELG